MATHYVHNATVCSKCHDDLLRDAQLIMEELKAARLILLETGDLKAQPQNPPQFRTELEELEWHETAGVYWEARNEVRRAKVLERFDEYTFKENG